MISEAFDKKSVASDTKSNGKYKTSIRNQIAFNKKSITVDTKLENYRKSLGNQ